jgi:cell division septal protein FtsQ
MRHAGWVALALTTAFVIGCGAAEAQVERIAEIRVHGNTRVADDEVLKAAGLQVGGSASETSLDDAKRRLEKWQIRIGRSAQAVSIA